jgi:hypothetical protein
VSSVEPESKPHKKKKEHSRGTQCLNCGLAIDTNYCPNCGQHNTNHNHGLGQFLHEFLDEFLHLDSKILRTWVPLLTKPGFLTQEWVAGKRVRYITPLKLYLTLSAFCFLALSFKPQLYGEQPSDLKINVNQPAISITRDDQGVGQKVSSKDSYLDSLFKRKIGTPDKARIEAIKNQFISRLPTTNFILMPFVAGIFHLLYIRRKRFYVEHLVFTLHYYSFVFLVFTASSLLPPHFLVSKILSALGFLWVFVYLPVALVKNFQQGYGKTIVKLMFFGAAYSVALGIALAATFIATAIAFPDNEPLAVESNAPKSVSQK